MDTNGPQKPNIKNLIAILLGIAFVVSGIAFLQSEKANRQLAEQLRQAEEKAKTAEAEVATLRATIQTLTGTAAPSTVPDTAGQGTPALPPAAPESSGTPPEADQPPAPELLAQEINENARLIRARVEQAWRIPPGTPASLACVVKIELLPSGEVQNVSLVESSGNAAFDSSTLAAVSKASPFPMPASAEAAARFRSFNFRFKPAR